MLGPVLRDGIVLMKDEMTAMSLASGEFSRAEETAPGAVPWVGMKALMLAVLDDAILCLRSPRSPVRLQSEHWIKSRERQYVFSFAVICETLALEPSAVRRSVMELVNRKGGRAIAHRRSRPNVRSSGSMQLAKGRRVTLSERPTHAP